MIKYLIVDDEPLAHNLIRKFADEIPHLQLKQQCYNALEALAYLQKHQVDLIFLDLHMPRLSGFDFLRTLAQPPKVIVTTAHKEFALEGYELNVADYLLKPFSFERFLKAINNAFPAQAPAPPPVSRPTTDATLQRLFVKGDKAYHNLHLPDILFLEAYGSYTKVHLPTGMLLTHAPLSFYVQQLPSVTFLRVHKSFIVATTKIDRIAGNRIYLANHEVPIGQTFKQQVMALLP
ncbi:MAG: LytR/AlgR family response regulator transcription factor [Lewinella sp.]|uniref:LytR/AlgR family response regulator transcription factor n=1 Tax=Lewinella sp. TaxID=2004506 RepID=UPI003D6B192B